MAKYVKRYGEIESATIKSYFKYKFKIEVKTTSGCTLSVTTGGISDCIYRYDPESKDWDDHFCAGIIEIIVIVAPPAAPFGYDNIEETAGKEEQDDPAVETCAPDEAPTICNVLEAFLLADLRALRYHNKDCRKMCTPPNTHLLCVSQQLIELGFRDLDVISALATVLNKFSLKK